MDKERFYASLEIGYKENPADFERRRRIGLGKEEIQGCGKCRWRTGGCHRCNDPNFVLGTNEGLSGGICRPGSEFDLQKCSEFPPGYDSNVAVECYVR